jgi:hypothetical protein
MRTRGVGIVVLVIAATTVSCSGGRSTPERSTPEASPFSTAVATRATTRLSAVVLTAGLGSRVSGWTRVAVIPFGEDGAHGELGWHLQRREGLNVIPPSFTVAADGSIWILDARNARLAHYSRSGKYLGWAGHFAWRTIWDARDVIWGDDRLYVLSSNVKDVAAEVTSVGPEHGRDPPVPISLNGDPAVVYTLVAGSDDVVGEMHGSALNAGHRYGTEPPGWARLAVPGDGSAAMLTGVPLENGTTMAVRAVGFPAKPDRFEIVTHDEMRTSVLPFELRVTDAHSRRLGVAGSEVVVAGTTGNAIVCFVQVASSELRPGGGTEGSRWMLEVSDDGSPLAWERLPDPRVADEAQVRHLSVGGDGAVYLMVAGTKGETIYRRSNGPP